MAIFNGFKGSAIAGLAIGVGAAFVAPALLPVIRTLARPGAKAVIKAGVQAYEQARVALAELGEVTDDLVAEVRAELAAEHQQASEPQGPGVTQATASSPAAPPLSAMPGASPENFVLSRTG